MDVSDISYLSNSKSLIIIALKNCLLTLSSCLAKFEIWIKHLIKSNHFFTCRWLVIPSYMYWPLLNSFMTGPYHTETSPSICNANQFTGFRIQKPVKQLKWSVLQKYSVNYLLQRKHFGKQICSYKTNFYPKVNYLFCLVHCFDFLGPLLIMPKEFMIQKRGKVTKSKETKLQVWSI